MTRPTLFQYAILWHPTEKQFKDDDAKSILLKEVTTILAKDINEVNMIAAMEIPVDRKGELSQIQIAVRPF